MQENFSAFDLASHDLTMLMKTDEDLYQSRHYFNLDYDQIVCVSHRITITFNKKTEVTETDMDGVEYTFKANEEEDFYYHVWFNRHGTVWFLITENPFPNFGVDVPYYVKDSEYDTSVCGRGSRHYYFQDIIFHSVKDAFVRKAHIDFKSHYIWDRAKISTFKYKPKEDEL
jgi:hypothetical protein